MRVRAVRTRPGIGAYDAVCDWRARILPMAAIVEDEDATFAFHPVADPVRGHIPVFEVHA